MVKETKDNEEEVVSKKTITHKAQIMKTKQVNDLMIS